jgi:hypothetical protein
MGPYTSIEKLYILHMGPFTRIMIQYINIPWAHTPITSKCIYFNMGPSARMMVQYIKYSMGPYTSSEQIYILHPMGPSAKS